MVITKNITLLESNDTRRKQIIQVKVKRENHVIYQNGKYGYFLT